jgi:nitroimidazol reductase NimA-like FMN-containing flavoprotein (pyridoxamine 5'-phosphate oxidase superfamily)
MNDAKAPLLSLDDETSIPDPDRERSLYERLRDLLRSQPFAVLCTQGAGQPYGSVVAYAINEELDGAVFATARATRKYELLTHCDRVALVIDSRSVYPGELMKVEAITATGRALELADREHAAWSARLINRHRELEAFVTTPSTAVFRVEIARYLYVTRFQEVYHWTPGGEMAAPAPA